MSSKAPDRFHVVHMHLTHNQAALKTQDRSKSASDPISPAVFSVLIRVLANQAGEAGLTILAKVVDVDGDGWVSGADVEVCLAALHKVSA